MAASFISRSSVFRSVGIGKCYFPPDTTVPFMDVARSVKHNNPDVIAAPTLRSSRPHLILTARRFAATTSITPPDNMAILNEQRKSRPQSPHLTIYQPQVRSRAFRAPSHSYHRHHLIHPPFVAIRVFAVVSSRTRVSRASRCLGQFADPPQVTWILSSANRITGVFLSGALYGASMLYLLHPVFPSFDSASLVQLAHDMPTWLKGGLKFLFVVPFTFHTFNGIRHLAWDTGYGERSKALLAIGYNANGGVGRIVSEGSVRGWLYGVGGDGGFESLSRVLYLRCMVLQESPREAHDDMYIHCKRGKIQGTKSC